MVLVSVRSIMVWRVMVWRVVVRRVMMRRVVVINGVSAARVSFVVFPRIWPAVHFAVVRPAVAVVVAMVIMTMLGLIAGPSAVVASAIVMEAMPAPTVSVSPAGPGARAQEDAVIKVSRSVKALGRAAVGWSFIIAPWAGGWFADFYDNLRANLWRQGQARKQCCRAE